MYALPSQTEKGVRSIATTMTIFIFVQLLSVAILAAFLPLLMGAVVNQSAPEVIAAAITLLAVACVLIIVIVVGLIMGLIGLIALYKGRDEFGPQHAQKFDRALILLVVGIIVPTIVGGIAGAAEGAAGAVGLTPRVTAVSAVASLVGGLLGALFIGLFLLWSIETLATPPIQQRGMIALAIGTAAGATTGAVSLIVLYAVPIPTSTPTVADLLPFLIPAAAAGVLSLISLALWIVTYRAVLGRFRSGELRAAPPAVMYPPPYGQPYPPYGPPPYGPPPQQPPPGP